MYGVEGCFLLQELGVLMQNVVGVRFLLSSKWNITLVLFAVRLFHLLRLFGHALGSTEAQRIGEISKWSSVYHPGFQPPLKRGISFTPA